MPAMTMTTAEIIKVLGGVTSVARLLDIKPPSVHAWLRDGIPEARLRELAAQIEIKSFGRFSRRERWPENFQFYWPELAETPANPGDHATKNVAQQGA
jgi:DNA-binding transcriptional regulator YdaS (Cro superfamily)